MKTPESGAINRQESVEFGKNVLVSIDLIRHPEKDHKTGNLTEEGKERFFQELKTDFGDGEEFDMIKFYVSPLPRGQQAMEPINRYKAETENKTTIRNKPELVGRFLEVNGTDFKKQMGEILEASDTMTRAQIDAMRARDAEIPAWEPATKDFETRSNEILIRDYFDQNLPGAPFTGREHAEVVKELVDHFTEVAKRLKSGSKVKLVLVGHSGVIEYLTKYVYLQNHPEVKPEDVNIEKIGGLVDFTQGPEITIQSDETGKQEIDFKFGGQRLNYTPSE